MKNADSTSKTFAISIVTPVYNVAKYLDEMVRSILRQDIGFKANIQLVLVDDGSTDGSGALCDAWAKQHPDNIAVIHQANQRQAVARKNGLALATGKYVNFCDPDDLLSKNACRRAKEMLDANPGVDMATLPVRRFGTESGEDKMNGKFGRGSRILDLERESGSVTIRLVSSFFRRESLHRFEADPYLTTAEDAKETLKILIRNPKVGLVADATYLYRKHRTSTTALWMFNKDGWLNGLERYDEWLVSESTRVRGEVLPFVWHTILYDLSWHFGPIPSGVMGDDERKAYRARMLDLCRRMDDDVLLEHKWLDANRKSFLLARKRAEPPRLVREGLNCFRLETPDGLLLPCRAADCKIFKLEVEKGGVRVFAQVTTPAFASLPPCELVARCGSHEIVFSRTGEFFDRLCADAPLLRAFQAEAVLPFRGKESFKAEFFVRFEGFDPLPVHVSFASCAPVRENLPNSFFAFRLAGRAFLLRPNGRGFSVAPSSAVSTAMSELRFDLSLLLTLDPGKIAMLCYRCFFRLFKPFAAKRTWLLVDHPMHASGDAFELFKYLVAHRRELGVNPKYVLHPGSKDWKKARGIGPVVPFTPFRYGLSSLLSDWTVSSRDESAIRRPFQDRQHLCADLAHGHRFAFFPNEDTQTRPANAFSRMASDFSLYFTASADQRADFLADKHLGYGADTVVVTGMPRFDGFPENTGRDILFAPSWRTSLFKKRNPWTGECPLDSGLEKSDWFTGLCAALGSGELLSEARKTGIQIRLMPHPAFAPHLSKFAAIPGVASVVSPHDKETAYATAAICVTDDPDVAADFAFLRRPVVFFRPDGTPAPEDEDLGPVGRLCRTLGPTVGTCRELVSYLISTMKDGFPLGEPYRSRMESFIAFHDHGNSQRAARAVLDADARLRLGETH